MARTLATVPNRYRYETRLCRRTVADIGHKPRVAKNRIPETGTTKVKVNLYRTGWDLFGDEGHSQDIS